MAINWNDQDILLMGSQFGNKLRYSRNRDVDEVTLNKLAIWFMDNYDDLYDIYRQSGRLLNFMDHDDTDFLENAEDNRPSLEVYRKSLERESPAAFFSRHYVGYRAKYFDLFKEKYERQWIDVLYHLTKFHNRMKKIYASGLWVKPTPLAQEIWALRTTILSVFALLRFAIWYYPTLYLKVPDERPETDERGYVPTYRHIISKVVEDWFDDEDIHILGPELSEYTEEMRDIERRKMYQQWGVDPVLLQEQRAFITSLALLIRRGLSERDRMSTTFQEERYNTAKELKALAQIGWAPKLIDKLDVQECPKCGGQGYLESAKGKRRKCTPCQGWGHIGEHTWLYKKQYDTGRYSQNDEVRRRDIRNQNQRSRFERLVYTFKSECVGNYK